MKKGNKRSFFLTIVGTILCLSAMIFFNHFTYYNSIMAKMENQGMGVLREVKESVEKYFTKTIDVVQLTAFALEYMVENNVSPEEIEKFLTYESSQYEDEIERNFSGIYGVVNGTFVHGSGWQSDTDNVTQESVWYRKAIENPGEVVLSPYFDEKTQTMMLAVSKLLSDRESVIAVNIELDEIQSFIENLSLNGAGYTFIVDNNGQVISHSNTSEIGKNYLKDAQISPVLDEVFEQEQSYFAIQLGDKKYQICARKIMEDWYVVAVLDTELFFSEVSKTLVRNILLYCIVSFLILFIYIYSFRRIQHSVKLERDVKEKIELTNVKLIRALVRTIDAKDRYTNGHSVRVAEYAQRIAQRLGKSEEEQKNIYYAGLLHDVGKIRVLDEIINKPERLTDEEYAQIKIHPVTGYHILKDIYDNKAIAMGVKFHHERYDGKGYPLGLSGENIPEIARILAVADTYDAMTSNRSYRKALDQEKVCEEIESGKGTQFDPEIADIMLQMIEEDRSYQMKETFFKQKTILVVDDELENIRCIEQFMQDESIYNIVNASNGEEGLRILDEIPVHLILLDVEMSEMNGFEAFKRSKEKYNIPTILVTGEKGMYTTQDSTVLCADEYISKPFNSHMLKEIIHSMLNE